MAQIKPETGFVPEAKKLFGNEEVVYIKVGKGGQPVHRHLRQVQNLLLNQSSHSTGSEILINQLRRFTSTKV